MFSQEGEERGSSDTLRPRCTINTLGAGIVLAGGGGEGADCLALVAVAVEVVGEEGGPVET